MRILSVFASGFRLIGFFGGARSVFRASAPAPYHIELWAAVDRLFTSSTVLDTRLSDFLSRGIKTEPPILFYFIIFNYSQSQPEGNYPAEGMVKHKVLQNAATITI